LRFFLSETTARAWGDSFPWAILIVNVTGSLLIGFLYAATGPEARWPIGSELREVLMVGFCGGYTTFSAFSLQTLHLLKHGDWFKAGGNVLGSVALCLVAVWLGHLAGIAANGGTQR